MTPENAAVATFTSVKWYEIVAFVVPFVLAVLVDLTTHKKGQTITMKNAAVWSVIWVLCSFAFGAFIWVERSFQDFSLYTTGYLLEKALAVDNLFAFYLIFKSFGLTQGKAAYHQHRILYWGILGAILLRVLFLGMGAFIVNLSHYVLIIFALIVLWTVWKMWKSDDEDEEVDYTHHWSVNLVRRFAKTNPSIASGNFFDHGVTPLFLCLICIEVCDVVFAFDSMPVIVAVVRDPYLMITSSLWAAAGLRSLYFLLIAAQNLFWALDKAIMLLLVFVAGKLIGNAFEVKVDNWISLTVIGVILAGGVIYSLVVKNPDEEEKKPEDVNIPQPPLS